LRKEKNLYAAKGSGVRMLDIIVTALKAIIDLLYRRDENNKNRLETKLREQELNEKNNLVQKASIEDVKKYDPKYQAIEKNKQQSSGCFVASVVYGSKDAPEVIRLQDFRDNILRHSMFGRIFIRIYYFIGPKTAWLLNRSGGTSRFILRKVLDQFIHGYLK
jgi:hypothetical protein